jgi:hypothetical protein
MATSMLLNQRVDGAAPMAARHPRRYKDMTKLITACSLIVVLVGYFYSRSEGLIISVDANGATVYSNSLQSSGGNDGYLMTLGLFSFCMTFVPSLFALLKKISERRLKIIYLVNLSILLFDIYLVNLDTSVIDSIKFGDISLLVGFTFSILPLMFMGLTMITNKNHNSQNKTVH